MGKKIVAILFILFGGSILLVANLAPSAVASKTHVKNVIVMIGDGCGCNHILATDYYQYGEASRAPYESFPFQWAMSTYSNDGKGYDPLKAKDDFEYVKSDATDSAAAATAMATGKKTYNGAIGMNRFILSVENVVERAEMKGKATGVVTSVPMSHATPAGFVAHNKRRDAYEEIAREMLLKSAVDVIMGAGNPDYDNDGKQLASPKAYQYVGGADTWQKLVDGSAGADADGDKKPDPWKLLQTREDFQTLMSGATPKRVIGIPQVIDTLQQARGGDDKAAPFVVPFNLNVPTLSEMTVGALNVLDNDPDGFFLMVEGGAIDWAGHANQSGRLVEEVSDFNEAVATIVDWVEKNSNWDETLLIVTADHETGYITGPGPDPEIKPLINNGKGKLPGMEWHSGGHTNSLVPIYVNGNAGRLFAKYADKDDPLRGKYIDNTDIARVIFSVW